MYEIAVKEGFVTAHSLLLTPKGIREKKHRHRWSAEIIAGSRALDPDGLVVDFRRLRRALRAVVAEFAKKPMNDHPYFKTRKMNPSTENVARYLYERISRTFRAKGVRIAKVTVWETPGASASYWK